MTANAIAYFKNLETERANRAQEQLRQLEIDEARRHNLAAEYELGRHQLAAESETQRHNLASEQLTGSQLAETKRSNLRSESLKHESIQNEYKLGVYSQRETNRHNAAVESETNRHNTQTEVNDFISFGDSSARTSETVRHNKASEGLEIREQNLSAMTDALDTLLNFGSSMARTTSAAKSGKPQTTSNYLGGKYGYK